MTTGTYGRTVTTSFEPLTPPASTASPTSTHIAWFPSSTRKVIRTARSGTRTSAGTPRCYPARSFARVTRCGTGSSPPSPSRNTGPRVGSEPNNSSRVDSPGLSVEPRWRRWTGRGPSSRTWAWSARPPARCLTRPVLCTRTNRPTRRRCAARCCGTKDPRGCSGATPSRR